MITKTKLKAQLSEASDACKFFEGRTQKINIT